MRYIIIICLGLIYSNICSGKDATIINPTDTITFWHIYMGDSLCIQSNAMVEYFGEIPEMSYRKTHNKADLYILWGGCFPNTYREVELVDNTGKIVKTFSSDTETLRVISIPLDDLETVPRGIYKLRYNTSDNYNSIWILATLRIL